MLKKLILLIVLGYCIGALAIDTKDAIWFCRYNVGTGVLKRDKLISCMNYSRRVLNNYDKTLKTIQLQQKVEKVRN